MKILFVCTHNRCRSILAEALANQLGDGVVTAASAGSAPAGEVHPVTIQALKSRGVPVAGLQSKSWDKLEDFVPDAVITVCDSAAREECPLWLGDALKVHWGLADPSRLDGSHEEIKQAFDDTMTILAARINGLVGLLKQQADKSQIQIYLNSWQSSRNK